MGHVPDDGAARFVLRDDCPPEPDAHYGVWDGVRDGWAILPDSTYCYGLTLRRAHEAFDALEANDGQTWATFYEELGRA